MQGKRKGEVEMEAPAWWLLEVEGHLSNRENKNRIRKNLRKKLDGLKRQTDLPEGTKSVKIRQLEAQLSYFQRPPKPKKQMANWCKRKRPKSQQVNVGLIRQRERIMRFAVGHRLPPCLQELAVHIAAVECCRMVARIARARR